MDTPETVNDRRDVETLTWAAEQLGISKSTAYRLALAGKMPGAFKVGRQTASPCLGSGRLFTATRRSHERDAIDQVRTRGRLERRWTRCPN